MWVETVRTRESRQYAHVRTTTASPPFVTRTRHSCPGTGLAPPPRYGTYAQVRNLRPYRPRTHTHTHTDLVPIQKPHPYPYPYPYPYRNHNHTHTHTDLVPIQKPHPHPGTELPQVHAPTYTERKTSLRKTPPFKELRKMERIEPCDTFTGLNSFRKTQSFGGSPQLRPLTAGRDTLSSSR